MWGCCASPGANPTGRISTLNPHKTYLRQRWEEGCTSTNQLFDEIRERGFRGSMRTLRRHTAQLRAALTTPEPPPAPKARDIVGWIVRHPDNLTDDDRTGLADACDRCDELATTRDLVTDFAKMVCHLGGAKLEEWVSTAENGPVRELRSFASGLRKDWQAVTAGLTLLYSSGAAEGNLTRIKAIKRQMYGRSTFMPGFWALLLYSSKFGVSPPPPQTPPPKVTNSYAEGLIL